jgi:hypothetical protein
MSMVSDTIALAILELFIYLGTFTSSLFVIHKHGRNRSLGWIFVTLLSASRIGCCSYQIHTGNDSDSTQISDVFDFIDLAPLLSTLSYLLNHVYVTCPL